MSEFYDLRRFFFPKISILTLSKIIFDGNFLVIGGWGGDKLNSVERFDPREGNKCVQVKEMKESRALAAAAEHSGLIYVTGGWNEYEYLNTVEMFAFFRFS